MTPVILTIAGLMAGAWVLDRAFTFLMDRI